MWSPFSEDYDDEYLELPDWDRTITDVEEAKVRERKKKANAKKSKFGSAAAKIDLD